MQQDNATTNHEGFWDTEERNVAAIRILFRQLEVRLCQRPSSRVAGKLVHLAVHANSSIYYSEALERYYLNLARKSRITKEHPDCTPNSVLHVMTCCLRTGGHTRIVERWIESAPAHQKHSVALTRQRIRDDLPARLADAVSKHDGTIVMLDPESSITCNANDLRNVGMEYEFIILHHHMGDPVPLMAFGLPEFNRTVIAFNHAGHLFWLGRNAADMVIDIEESQARITRSKRGFVHNMIIDLPSDFTPTPPESDKRALRETLDIAPDCHLVASMASAYKYTVLPDYDFPSMLRQILERDPASAILMIGVAPGTNAHWTKLERDFPSRIFLKGLLPPAEAYRHLRAADLYIDSFPYNSFTSMLDAVIAGGLPAIALQTPVGLLPSFQQSQTVAASIPELVDMATRLLLDPEKCTALHEATSRIVSNDTDPSHFQEHLTKAYKLAGTISKDASRYRPVEESITKFDMLANALQRNLSTVKTKELRIAGFPLYLRKKNVYGNSLNLLGLPIYKRTLANGAWQRSILGCTLR